MATRIVTPRADSEGGIGKTDKAWATGYFDDLNILNDLDVTNDLDVGGDLTVTGDIVGYSSDEDLFGTDAPRTFVTNNLMLMVKIPFDNGVLEPDVDDELIDDTNGRHISFVYADVVTGSWTTNDAAGFIYAKALTDAGEASTPSYYATSAIADDVVFELAATPQFTVDLAAIQVEGCWFADPDYDNLGRSDIEVQSTTTCTISHNVGMSKIATAQISKEAFTSAALDTMTVGIHPVTVNGSLILVLNAGTPVNFKTLSNCTYDNHLFVQLILA